MLQIYTQSQMSSLHRCGRCRVYLCAIRSWKTFKPSHILLAGNRASEWRYRKRKKKQKCSGEKIMSTPSSPFDSFALLHAIQLLYYFTSSDYLELIIIAILATSIIACQCLSDILSGKTIGIQNCSSGFQCSIHSISYFCR